MFIYLKLNLSDFTDAVYEELEENDCICTKKRKVTTNFCSKCGAQLRKCIRKTKNVKFFEGRKFMMSTTVKSKFACRSHEHEHPEKILYADIRKGYFLIFFNIECGDSWTYFEIFNLFKEVVPTLSELEQEKDYQIIFGGSFFDD